MEEGPEKLIKNNCVKTDGRVRVTCVVKKKQTTYENRSEMLAVEFQLHLFVFFPDHDGHDGDKTLVLEAERRFRQWKTHLTNDDCSRRHGDGLTEIHRFTSEIHLI